MRLELRACIRKDILEYFRTAKWLIFAGTLVALSGMVLFTTMFIPIAAKLMPYMSAVMATLVEYMFDILRELVPGNVRDNMGFWAADVGLFYTLVVAIVCSGLIPNEIRKGCRIVPSNCGYHKSTFVLSKCIVYGIGVTVTLVLVENLYYVVANLMLSRDYAWFDCLWSSLIYGMTLGLITACAIILSDIAKNSIVSCATLLAVVIILPDLLSLFNGFEFLPTYLMEFAYCAETDYSKAIIPMCLLVAVTAILFGISVIKNRNRK
ncbi:MAG: hypothetical protein KBT19_04350 [Lachnospiraceae bacterium]|nr:hypothetical protein [Candidatus Colinaster equi]